MKKLTLPVAMKLCAEMWDWLADNPNETSKISWPKWDMVKSRYGEIFNSCFACHIAKYQNCDTCPMLKVWKGRHCQVIKSPYQRWIFTKSRFGRSRNAKIIADGARKALADYNKKKNHK